MIFAESRDKIVDSALDSAIRRICELFSLDSATWQQKIAESNINFAESNPDSAFLHNFK